MHAFRTMLAATVVAAGATLSSGAIAANDLDSAAQAEELAAPPPPAPQGVFAAFVQQNGNLNRGIGVSSTRRLSRGEYEVVFNNNIRNCIWVASIGLPGTGNPFPGIVSTALRNGNNRAVYVITADQRAVIQNQSFSVIVTCP